jgi:hypothetical protein
MGRGARVVFVVALLVVFAQCGGRTDDGVAADVGVDGGGVCHASPPAGDPKSPYPASARPRFYAIRKLYLGDADRAGNASSSAWRGFGFDIDGRATTHDTPGPCALASGASKSTQVDGDCGIDNSFGENLLPIFLTSFASDLATRMNAAIADGGPTDIFVVDDVGSARDASRMNGEIVQGAPLGHSPAWDGADRWPVDEASLSGPGFEEGKLQLGGYLRDRVWVGTAPNGGGAITVVTVEGVPVRAPITRLVVSARISDDGSQLLDGTISAVIDAEGMIRALRGFLPKIGWCSWWQSGVSQQVRQASDILGDGTQDLERPCDGISIGLGFEASEIQIGPVVTAQTPPDRACVPDAGTD